MDLIASQYIEVNLIGLVVLLIMILYSIRTRQDMRRGDERYFVRMLYSNAGSLIADSMIFLMRGHVSPVLIFLNHIFSITFFILHTYFGYLWLQYSIRRLFPEYEPPVILKVLMQLPVYASVLVSLASPWTKWIYSIEAGNVYTRGRYIWVISFISFLYWAISAVLTLKEFIHPKRMLEHSDYIILLFFPIPTLIGILLQLKFYGLTIGWICSAVSLLVLFINLQNYQLSRDMLTGLFNRRQTNKQILWEIDHLPASSSILFCIMMDVDNFKKINDLYGHLTGDKALVIVSDILKSCCRNRNFIGRFGGDEFVILGHADDSNEVRALIDDINSRLDVYNDTSDSFHISLSYGYVLYNKNECPTIDELLSAADKEMYMVKNEKKSRLAGTDII